MKRYKTPEIDMIYYELDKVIMGEEESQIGDQITKNPFDDILNPTTSAGSAGGGIALKF